MSSPPKISVIIPVYNGAPYIEHLLRALSKQTLNRAEFEIIAVDNGSRDDSRERLRSTGRKLGLEIRVESLHSPKSSYACRNFGATLAKFELLAFTDVDCRPHPDWLSQIQSFFSELAHHDRALLAGAIELFPQGAAFTSCEWFDKCNFLRQKQSYAANAALTANLSVRRSDFQELHGFKEVSSGGDVEFTRRAMASGVRLHYKDSLIVSHPARGSLSQLKEKLARIAKGQAELRVAGRSLQRRLPYIIKHVAAMILLPIFWRTVARTATSAQAPLLLTSPLAPQALYLDLYYRICSIQFALGEPAVHTSRPRIAMILSRLKRGGGVRSQLTLANLLHDRGFPISILVHRGCNFGPSLPVRAQIQEVGLPVKNPYFSYLINTLFMLRAVRNYDIVISIFAPEYPLIRMASFLGGPRVVHFARHYDPILLDSSKVSSPFLLRLYGLAAKYSHLTFNEMLVNSSWTGEKICSELGKAIPYQVIPNGVDKNTFRQTRPKFEPNLSNLTFLVVGKPQKYKGLDDVLQALDEFHAASGQSFRLVIMTTDSLNLGQRHPYRIEIRHPANDQELVELYNSADVMLSASWLEGFCNPPLEAMACGTPAVVTACGGIDEYAVDGENCLIVPVKSPQLLAQRIKELIYNPELYQRLISGGLKTSERFSWEDSADRLEAVINR